MSTLTRVARTLALVPRRPKSVTVQVLVERLRDEGHAVNHRSVQRTLVILARSLPLLVDRRSKPYRWGWSCSASCPWVRL